MSKFLQFVKICVLHLHLRICRYWVQSAYCSRFPEVEHSKKMVQQARKYVRESSIFKLFGEGTDCNKRFTPDGNMSKILTKIKLYNPMKGMNRSV